MGAGTARRARIDSAGALVALVSGLKTNEALALVRLRDDLPDTVRVITAAEHKKLDANAAADSISRTSDYLGYRPGEPAWALLDFDQKGMPPAVPERLRDAGGFDGALRAVIPGIEGVATVVRKSTSSGLRNSVTGERLPGSGGLHVFALVKDGADIGRFLDTLHQRVWLAGLGWLMLGRAGQFLERSIVDRAGAGAERFVFEGPPIVEAPLEQDTEARFPMAREGAALDTIAACPPLTAAEEARVKTLIAAERHRLKPASAHARAVFVREHAARIAERAGVSPERAREIAERHVGGILLPSVEPVFDEAEFASATVGNVLSDPELFLGQTLRNPLEGIEYGAGKAMILRRADGEIFVNSFAHGGVTYELRYDFAAISAAIDAAPAETVVGVYAKLCLTGDLDDDERETLRNIAASRAGVARRTVDRALKRAAEEKRAQRAREAADRRAATRRDPRPEIEAPAPDAPWLPTMNVPNEIFGASAAPEPPMRDIDGQDCLGPETN